MTNSIKYLTITITIIILIFFAYFVTNVLLNNPTSNNEQIVRNKGSFDETKSIFLETNIYKNMTGAATGNVYLGLNEEIENYKKDIIESEGKIPLSEMIIKKNYLYKAIGTSLALDSVDDGKSETLIAMNGLYDAYVSVNIAEREEKLSFLKHKTVILYNLNAVFQAAKYKELFNTSKWTNNEEYRAILKKTNNNLDLAYLMYMDLLFSGVRVPDDKLMVSFELNNLAKILDFYSAQITPKDQQIYAFRAQKLFREFNQATTSKLIYSISYVKNVIPFFYNTYALAIFSKYDPSIKNEKVMLAFSDLESRIQNNLSGKDDFTNVIKARTNFQLAKYLFNQNDFKVTKEIKSVLLEISSFPITYANNPYFLKFYSLYLYEQKNNPTIKLLQKADKDFNLLINKYN